MDVLNVIAHAGFFEMAAFFAIGAVLCYLLGSAPRLGGLVVLALSLVAAFKAHAITGNLVLAILVFFVTGGVFVFVGFMSDERRKAKAMGFSSIREMNRFEAGLLRASREREEEEASSSHSDSGPTDAGSRDGEDEYTVAHPLFGVVGTAAPLIPYDLKQRFLETPPLKDWTMEQFVYVESERLREDIDRCERLPRQEALERVEYVLPIVEDNLASGDPCVVEAFHPSYLRLKEIAGDSGCGGE